MREERKSAVQSHSEELGGRVEGERVAQKRDGGPEGGFAGGGAEERHLAFRRVQRKLPLLRPRFESVESCLDSGSSRIRRSRRRPDSKIVRIKRKTDGWREDRREVINEEVEEDRTEDGSLRHSPAYPEGITGGAPQRNTSSAVGEERLGPANKTGGQARGKKLVEESRMPDRVKGTRKIHGG